MGNTKPNNSDTYIVSNRLPFEYNAFVGWRRSPGGLVRVLEAALQKQGVVWVGWRGSHVQEDNLVQSSTCPPQTGNLTVIEVHMTQNEESYFYDGVCNSSLWPLYHDAATAPEFCDEEFEVYQRINKRFADCVAHNAPSNALVWVHDYHLQLVPALLREIRPDLRIGFFLHVPFPSPAIFSLLPWKENILSGLLGANLIGFQTASCAKHFIEEVCQHLPATRNERGIVLQDAKGSRYVAVDVFPVGPDSGRFRSLAANPAVREAAATIRANLGEPELILLGVDRLDYTKGIELRIRAVTDILTSIEFRDRDIQFIQVAAPSRSKLKAYQHLRFKVEETLRLANEKLVSLGLRPIHYFYESLQTEQVVALYLNADIMLVTSFADGMNLVSKEYVACHGDGTGRLVLSRTAGAADQLRDAWLVDPSDLGELKRIIADSILAGADEAHLRMNRMHRDVMNADAKHWAESFFNRLREAR